MRIALFLALQCLSAAALVHLRFPVLASAPRSSVEVTNLIGSPDIWKPLAKSLSKVREGPSGTKTAFFHDTWRFLRRIAWENRKAIRMEALRPETAEGAMME